MHYNSTKGTDDLELLAQKMSVGRRVKRDEEEDALRALTGRRGCGGSSRTPAAAARGMEIGGGGGGRTRDEEIDGRKRRWAEINRNLTHPD